MKCGFVIDPNVPHLPRRTFNAVTIPIEFLDKLGLRCGDPIEVRVYKDRITIRKSEVLENEVK